MRLPSVSDPEPEHDEHRRPHHFEQHRDGDVETFECEEEEDLHTGHGHQTVDRNDRPGASDLVPTAAEHRERGNEDDQAGTAEAEQHDRPR